jgi:SAM-dependent methyltransferase
MTSSKEGTDRKPIRRRKRSVGRGLVPPGAEGVGADTDPTRANRQQTDRFYRAFEERFRGPRSLVKTRLKAYLPFVLPLVDLHEPASAIDLGCGRGEWLELLLEHGINARGVDLDRGMLQACLELGLHADEGEAISHLQALSDESCSIVSGFHIAEHLPFDSLKTLVAEALRVLKPGGLLILETPNPENIIVGTTDFYMDPTHLRPIPPRLLAFLPEHQGFLRCKIVRLQDAPGLLSRPQVSLMDVLAGVSPDYAVVAQKAASDQELEPFSALFEQSYGVELGALAESYSRSVQRWVEGSLQWSEQRIGERLSGVEEQIEALRLEVRGRAEATKAQIESLHDRLAVVTKQATTAQARTAEVQMQLQAVDAQNSSLHEQLDLATAKASAVQRALAELHSQVGEQNIEFNRRLDQAVAEARHWQQQYTSLITSTSWRITRPLRACKSLGTKAVQKMSQLCKVPIAWLLAKAIGLTLKWPALGRWVNLRLKAFPGLRAHMLMFAQKRGLVVSASEAPGHPEISVGDRLSKPVAIPDSSPIPRRSVAPVNRDQMGPLELNFTGEDEP